MMFLPVATTELKGTNKKNLVLYETGEVKFDIPYLEFIIDTEKIINAYNICKNNGYIESIKLISDTTEDTITVDKSALHADGDIIPMYYLIDSVNRFKENETINIRKCPFCGKRTYRTNTPIAVSGDGCASCFRVLPYKSAMEEIKNK